MNRHEPEQMNSSSHVVAMSRIDHHADSYTHTQEALTRRVVGDNGWAYAANGQATSAGAARLLPTMGSYLFLTHDAVPPHYSHDAATRCGQCFGDNGVQKQTAGEHPLLGQARSRSRRALLLAQLHCIFDLSMKGEYRAYARGALGWQKPTWLSLCEW